MKLYSLALEACSVWKARQIYWNIRKYSHDAVCEEAEALTLLVLPTGQWSKANLKFHQGLVAEVVLDDSPVAITVTLLELHRNPIERPKLKRNGLWFLRKTARSWCLAIHLVCSRSKQQKGTLLSTNDA